MKEEIDMHRVVQRVLPDGIERMVNPFHICLKGLEKAVLCRDDEDYDAMVKQIAICAKRKNVQVIIYAVVSNHAHVAILAVSQQDADAFAQELKRVYAMWFRLKYQEANVLRRTDAKAILLDNDWYVRNALAYIPRNALDNGCPVQEYRWSGFRAMFRATPEPRKTVVRHLTKRERESIMHTGDDLRDVPWALDDHSSLIPDSFCDTAYLEQAFHNDPAFFLKTIGSLNATEMQEKLVEAPRRMLPDSEFYKVVADTVQRWFSQDISTLPREKKQRIIPYIWRTQKTTPAQLARVFGLSQKEIKSIVKPRTLGKVGF